MHANVAAGCGVRSVAIFAGFLYARTQRNGQLALNALPEAELSIALFSRNFTVCPLRLKRRSSLRSRTFSSSTSSAIPSFRLMLPFENRSEEKANAYFADGIQDEILTRLAKIADLKVISRTSTQHYKSAPENVPEIAGQLGVAHVFGR